MRACVLRKSKRVLVFIFLFFAKLFKHFLHSCVRSLIFICFDIHAFPRRPYSKFSGVGFLDIFRRQDGREGKRIGHGQIYRGSLQAARGCCRVNEEWACAVRRASSLQEWNRMRGRARGFYHILFLSKYRIIIALCCSFRMFSTYEKVLNIRSSRTSYLHCILVSCSWRFVLCFHLLLRFACTSNYFFFLFLSLLARGISTDTFYCLYNNFHFSTKRANMWKEENY